MTIRNIKAGFVGFGEVNTPRELIERKCLAAQSSLHSLGIDLVTTDPVRDDPGGVEEARARKDLGREDFDLLVVCLAGWIPTHTVIDVIAPFAHKPMVLWGLTGTYEEGRLVTTADQAGTTALRDTMEGLGYKFQYVYDTPDRPLCGAEGVKRFGEVARAAALLKGSRVGTMGYRDMKLYATLVDVVSLRRVVGAEVEVIETLEIFQRMQAQSVTEVEQVAQQVRAAWICDQPIGLDVLDNPVRMYLAVMEKVHERGYQAVSLIDVDGVKKLLHFTPASAMMMLSDLGGLATVP